MTIVDNYFPFDTGPGATATAARWRLMARLFSGSGVIPGYLNSLAPSIAGSVVTVATGAVWIDGYYGEIDSPKTVGISGTGLVVMHMDPNSRQITLAYNSNATAAVQDPNGIFEVPLMTVTGAGAGSDIRQFALSANSTSTGSPTIPSGVIWEIGTATIPPGWLRCDGTSYLRTSYPTLFNAIGTTWGAADSTHFSVPDLRNRFSMMAWNTLALGAYGGTTTIQAAHLPPHTHSANTGTESAWHQHGGIQSPTSGGNGPMGLWGGSSLGNTGVNIAQRTGFLGDFQTGNQNALHYHSLTTDNGPGSSATFYPPAAGVNKIIKI